MNQDASSELKILFAFEKSEICSYQRGAEMPFLPADTELCQNLESSDLKVGKR